MKALKLFGSVRDKAFIWYHRGSAQSSLRKIYQAYLRSRLFVRYHFGINIACREKPQWYYNLSTLALRNAVEKRAKEIHSPALLEIGTGSWVLLSGYLSRRLKVSIDACDCNADFLKVAEEQVAHNQLDVNLFQSDICSGIPAERKYDLIFWNPDYHLGNRTYLPQLLDQAVSRLKPGGSVMIVYKVCPDGQEVREILGEHPAWQIVNTSISWLSPFEVLEVALHEARPQTK